MLMLKYIFSKVFIYLIILVFVVPAIILFMLGNASRKQMNNDIAGTPTGASSDFPSGNVPLPTKEDVIRTFCNLVDEGEISEAIEMMDVEDDVIQQSWGVYFNNFSSFKLINVNKSSIDENENFFEVDIDATLKKDLSGMDIPNYGWENGLNKRWFNLVEKEKGLYKISEIATGP